MVRVKTSLRPIPLFALLTLAIGLLSACGSGTGASASTTTTVAASTSVSEGTSTTTSPSIVTTTTEPGTTTTEADVTEFVIEGGEVVSGPDRIEAELGSTVMFVVVSDAVDHVHVHGYDIFFDVAPGTPAEIEFTADVPGIFEIELEESHILLVELEVR